MRTIRARVRGKVQGVAFRHFTREKAKALGLVGWVRNLQDGTVELIYQGEGEAVAAMTGWLWTGSPFAKVDAVETATLDQCETFADFVVRH